jgi:hypothetical protein
LPSSRGTKEESHARPTRAQSYSHRWIVERTISWISNFRRTGVQQEYFAQLLEGEARVRTPRSGPTPLPFANILKSFCSTVSTSVRTLNLAILRLILAVI